MKYFNLILLSSLILLPSYADSSDVKLEYDQVSIGYIPSKYASMKGDPYTTLVAKALTHHKNKEIEKFFIQLNKLASEGITDNATRFHKRTKYIEAVFQGKRVRLFFAGDSNLDKFRHYEERWKVLHKKIYEYLIKEISPNNSNSADKNSRD